MSRRVTQTITLTLAIDPDEHDGTPREFLFEALDAYADYGVEVTDVSATESSATSTLTTAQKAKLLELKGWVYGEHLKQQAGLPSEWDQSNWLTGTSCGTACCVAGKVALDAGAVPTLWNNNGARTEVEVGEVYSAVRLDGITHDVSDFAASQLGLSEPEANDLFSGYNKYEDIAAVIDRLVAT